MQGWLKDLHIFADHYTPIDTPPICKCGQQNSSASIDTRVVGFWKELRLFSGKPDCVNVPKGLAVFTPSLLARHPPGKVILADSVWAGVRRCVNSIRGEYHGTLNHQYRHPRGEWKTFVALPMSADNWGRGGPVLTPRKNSSTSWGWVGDTHDEHDVWLGQNEPCFHPPQSKANKRRSVVQTGAASGHASVGCATSRIGAVCPPLQITPPFQKQESDGIKWVWYPSRSPVEQIGNGTPTEHWFLGPDYLWLVQDIGFC